MSMMNYRAEQLARETPDERAKREAREKRYSEEEDIEYIKKLIPELDERIKNPSDGGWLAKKVSTLNDAKTNLGYDEAQLEVIHKVDELRELLNRNSNTVFGNYTKIVELTKDIKRSGKTAFPESGKFKRLARFFSSGKGKNKRSILPWGTPMWYINAGGKYRTHKRRTHKRRTHKRRN
jgi:hypothetical protein